MRRRRRRVPPAPRSVTAMAEVSRSGRRAGVAGGGAPQLHHGRGSARGWPTHRRRPGAPDRRRRAGREPPPPRCSSRSRSSAGRSTSSSSCATGRDNVVVVCSIENVDPMGVHTGDSVTVAPAHDADRPRVPGGCATLAIDVHACGGGGDRRLQHPVRRRPGNGRLVVIEMNPRVSRSSALASKATGFPIAKIAAKAGRRLHPRRDPSTTSPARPRRASSRRSTTWWSRCPGSRSRSSPADPTLTTHDEVGGRGDEPSAAASPRRCRRRCARWRPPRRPRVRLGAVRPGALRPGALRPGAETGRRETGRPPPGKPGQAGAAGGGASPPTTAGSTHGGGALRLRAGAIRGRGGRSHLDRPLVPRPDRPARRGGHCASCSTPTSSAPPCCAGQAARGSPTPRSACAQEPARGESGVRLRHAPRRPAGVQDRRHLRRRVRRPYAVPLLHESTTPTPRPRSSRGTGRR